ncbi:MAG: hypothetical protein IJA91_06595 [Clostridia bacterium]|nr:hypothetical protein [Clostridia bacterium]
MSTDKKQPKKKKEKITYIDDGSTIADMSGVGRKPANRPVQPVHGGRQKRQPTTRAGSAWQTYKDAVRSMIGPMLVTLGGITVVFALLWIILGFFA